MKVYGYVRVSGLGQRDKDGPERQKIAIIEFAQKHELELVNVFVEQVTGTRHAFDRPAFSQMVESAEENGVTGIIVERLDRLSRELVVQEVAVSKLSEDFGLAVYSADYGELEDISSPDADPTRVLIRQVLGVLAQYNRAEIVHKLAQARKRKREETGRCEGAKPFGYYRREQPILSLIDTYMKEGYKLSEIADMLNAADLRTRFGRPWNRSNVYHIVNRLDPDYAVNQPIRRKRAERNGNLRLEK